MPLIDHTTIEENEFYSLGLSIIFIVTMIATLTLCSCCKPNKSDKNEEDCTYGVVKDDLQLTTNKTSPINKKINFRQNVTNGRSERHSQPNTSKNAVIPSSTRVSAPLQTGRALPEVPSELYTVIDKSRKNSEIRFADETVQPVYESIDPETDSFVDPTYSKVVEVRRPAVTRDRRYDYPIFQGRKEVARNDFPDDTLYQSASQIYAPGSEDPYSSINSEPRRLQDGDTSDAYDPGYAKVTPVKTEPKKKVEKTERELDILYSKIRRRTDSPEQDQPGPSRVEAVLPPLQNLTSSVVTDPVQPQFDEMSVSSREPSYRYMTMRENANVVRERLLTQGQIGQLGQPIREHYYSTIGNEYESVDNPDQMRRPTAIPILPTNALSVSLVQETDAPPPPTSPIPDRTLAVSVAELSLQSSSRTTEGTVQAVYSTVNKQRGEPSSEVVLMAPTSTLPNINEFMTRPILPYNSREYSSSQSHQLDEESRTSRDVNDNNPAPAGSRLSQGPTVEEIISARRYRSSSSVHAPPPDEKRH